MKTVKRMSLGSFILPLIYPIFIFFLFLLVSLKLFMIFIMENNYLAMSIGVIFLLFLIIPSLILHFNYYIIDRNKVLTIDDVKNEVKIIDKDKKITFRFDEVDKVRMINSKNYDDTYRMLMPWKTHYYYMICLKNDDEYLITRLTVRKLEKILNVRIVYKREVFPFISKYVLERAKNT